MFSGERAFAQEFGEFTGELLLDTSTRSPNVPVAQSPEDIARAWEHVPPQHDPASRVISKAEGITLLERIVKFAKGGGNTQVTVRSSSVGNLRWARNRPTTSGITMTRSVRISRIIGEQWSSYVTTSLDDDSLARVVAFIERRLRPTAKEFTGAQTYASPTLWSKATFDVTALDRSNAARQGVELIASKELVAAGYVETDVETWGIYNTLGLAAYSAINSGLFHITARHPSGNGSGWRGVANDWEQIDTEQISHQSLDACLASANPKAVEPGRYTTILHQDAVAAMVFHITEAMGRKRAEDNPESIFGLEKGTSRIGTKVIDERLSLISDPLDPFTPFIPFDDDGYPMKPTTWIEKGILKELSYTSAYARERFGYPDPLPHPLSCRLMNTGPVVSVDDMIASTKRGIYMERVGQSRTVDANSLQIRTQTLNGLWLVEDGKIKYPIKNMHILESPMVIFNQVVHIGETQRAWGRRYVNPVDNIPSMALHGGTAPIAAPPIKVEDFNFVMLADAI